MLDIYKSDASRLSELNLQLKLKRVKVGMRRSLSSRLRDLDVNVHGPGSNFHVKVHVPWSKLPAKVRPGGPGSRFASKVHPGQDKVIS